VLQDVLGGGPQYTNTHKQTSTVCGSFWWDSPEGLRTATELIIGTNTIGMGPILNRLAVDPVVENQFVGLADQVTRHHIEEI